VVEPVLEIIKTSDDADGYVAAGQLVTYTLTIRHTGDSTADAFDLIINDPLPPELENFTLIRADIGATSVLGELFLDPVTGFLGTTGMIDLAQGEELIIEVSGNVILGTPGATIVSNVGEVLWSSLPDGLAGDEPGGVSEERTGAGGVNDYRAEDDEDLVVGLGSIGDIVWWDVNANAVQDGFEIGLPALTINLWRDDNGDGNLDGGDFFLTSTITDENGFYLFENLPTESDDGFGNVTQIQYLVEVVPTIEMVATYDLDGLGSLNTAAVTLDAGNENRLDVDFGYRGRSSIGDTIWNDANRDGVQQPGEVGIPGVGLTLVFSGGPEFGGNTMTLRATTDANGQYLFQNLIGGLYSITLDPATIPEGFTFTFDPDGLLDGRVIINLGMMANRRDADFGLALPLRSSLSYDTFNPFPLQPSFSNPVRFHDDGGRLLIHPEDAFRDAILPIAPIYSGSAEPGSTLVVVLYNAMGQEIGRQTVVVDTGGNWMATLPGVVVKDYPQSVVIQQTPPLQSPGSRGYNQRAFYASAVQPGHFFNERASVGSISERSASQVLEDYMLLFTEPIGFGNQMHAYEALAMPGHPTGR